MTKVKSSWTTKEIKLLRKYYPNVETKKLAKFFNRSITAVHRQAHHQGLFKSEEFRAYWGGRPAAQRPDDNNFNNIEVGR